MSLLKKLLQHKTKKICLFTTPSHNQRMPFKSKLGKNYYKLDLSEIDGLDDLNNPQECIMELENELKAIYNSGFTHILTNGSTQGILALMLAVLQKGDKVLTAINCHKCVHNGLILTGADPIWVYPTYDNNFSVYTSISPLAIEQAVEKTPNIKCLILTNPSYDGAISDIEKISDICKKHKIILIVDEAHGGLWNFDKTLGTPAILAGADASVQSLHKTCGAINPAALIHLSKNSNISKSRLMEALNIISTTSPSYALMANVEETIKFLNSKKGQKDLEKLTTHITEIINKIKKLEHLEIFHQNNDITKIFIRSLNIPAKDVSEIIYSKFKIECEIQHKNALTFLCGLGTTSKNLKNLLKALIYINKQSKKFAPLKIPQVTPPKREMITNPKEAFNSLQEEITISKAQEHICSQIVTTYPPGIPLLTYGEKITSQHLNFIDNNIKIRIVK